MNTFQTLHLSKPVQDALDELGFSEPTPIQQKAIPILKEGRDLIGQAQTGTGKTAAFGIPIVEGISKAKETQSLVLTPTRELALQVADELKKIAKFKKVTIAAVFGGQPIYPQIKALKRGAQIVVGTPGRVLDHLERGTLKTPAMTSVVLDEADEMLDMGFVQDIETILKQLPARRQTMLFSATLQSDIHELAKQYMRKPVTVSVTNGNEAASTVNQVFYRTYEPHKFEALTRIIDSETIGVAIIFCRTKKGASTLTEALDSQGYKAEELHGDLTQSQRLSVMKAFRRNRINLLVATDIAARGIDVAHVTHVINYDVPEDPEQYVHRIGRTGRAGKQGTAITFVTPHDVKFWRAIEGKIRCRIAEAPLPNEKELIHRKYLRLKKEIEHLLLSSDDHSLFESFSKDLLAHFPPEKAVTSLLTMMLSMAHVQVPEEYQFGETGAEKGMVRFFLNVGRNIDLHPKKLANEISDLASISPQEIRRIDIFDRFSFFEVASRVAPFVYECLKQEGINGSRIYLEPARPSQRSLHYAR